MKNCTSVVIAILFLTVMVLGCGMVSRINQSSANSGNSNKALADRAIETAIGEETTGVAECDQVLKMLAQEAENPDDGYVTKAVKGTVLNKIKQSLRTSIEQNKNDKAELAKNCREFKAELMKYKADANANKSR